MYSIKIQDSTGLWIVIDTNTGKNISRGALPSIAINLAIEKGMPASLRPTLLDDAAAIEQASAPPPTPTEPIPPAVENKTSPNTLTGSADADSGSEAKKNEAKTNPPNANGVYNENSSPMETQNSSFAGSTQAGQANNPSKQAGGYSVSTGELPGLRLQNPLSSLSSYTYQTSLYMITPDAYRAFIESGRTNIDAIKNAKDANAAADTADNLSGAYIIAQSGGSNNSDDSRAFNLDFYIDDLKITNVLQGPASGTSSNDIKMSFNIYEPYGFRLITKLTRAANLLRSVSKVKNYDKMGNATRQFFILGLRFQGYDEQGQVLSATTFPKDSFNTDGGGVFERFFDIYISSFKFKIDGKVTVYNIEAVPIGPGTAFGVKRGRLDKNVVLQGTTVDDALQDLAKKLNDEQQKIADADPKKESRPTIYKIDYIGGARELIGDQLIVNVADVIKNKWPMGEGIPNLAAVNENAAVNAVPNSNKRSLTFKNGGSVLQCIQNIITQSDYMLKALTTLFANEVELNTKPNSPDVKINNEPRTFRWYNVSSEVKVLGFDNSIKDFTFEIKYIIQPYDTPYVKSQNLQSTSKYYGPHKRYDYWYTGKNSEIISYEQTMNNQYFNATVNPGATSASSGGGYDVPSSPGKLVNEDKTGLLDDGKQTQNSVITSLFSPADYAMIKLTIIGDPDYLMTESSSSINAAYRQFYGNGFTINPNGGQVFIEIDFKEAIDYNSDSGLMDINESILFWNYPKEIRNIVKGVSYNVREVQHTFSKGKFTQELTCNINTFNNYRNVYRDIESDPNTNVGNERQTSDITKSGYTGLVGDAPVETVNPASGNQGGTNINASSPNAASQSNEDGIINNTIRPPSGDDDGRENPPLGGV